MFLVVDSEYCNVISVLDFIFFFFLYKSFSYLSYISEINFKVSKPEQQINTKAVYNDISPYMKKPKKNVWMHVRAINVHLHKIKIIKKKKKHALVRSKLLLSTI